MALKYLADMGISLKTVSWLRTSGYDASHLVEEGLYRLSDVEILKNALSEQRVILTMDLDFGYLLAISNQSLPSAVIFRLSDERAETVNRRLGELLDKYAEELVAGAVASVSDRTIRVRRLPFKPSE